MFLRYFRNLFVNVLVLVHVNVNVPEKVSLFVAGTLSGMCTMSAHAKVSLWLLLQWKQDIRTVAISNADRKGGFAVPSLSDL